MSDQQSKQGRIAFITTPRFRESSPEIVRDFVHTHLYELCDPFHVMTTGRTSNFLKPIVDEIPQDAERQKIRRSMSLSEFSDHDLERWKRTILGSLETTMDSFPGMIHVAYELVEGRIDAVVHFTDWEDKSAKPDSAVLSREANVHNVPIATDPDTALAYIKTWKQYITTGARVFPVRPQLNDPPLKGLKEGDRVLAMVAHDNMKLEICRFAVEYAGHIFKNYDYILATGTTGGWIKRFMEAAGRGPLEVNRIRCCYSGPMGGDIQIAFAVVKKICRKIIFLQDPSVSHPHDSDIRLFEQAVVAKGVHVELATNVESARLLIGV